MVDKIRRIDDHRCYKQTEKNVINGICRENLGTIGTKNRNKVSKIRTLKFPNQSNLIIISENLSLL